MIIKLRTSSVSFILIIYLFTGITSFAGVKDKGFPFIVNHSKKEYNAGTQNWDFVQDSRGVLYVANYNGVMVYDGQDWELIPMPNRSVVRCLFRDENDRIFVGAYNEFGYLSPDPSGILSYTSLAGNIDGFEPGEVWRIKRQKNLYYFQTYNALIIYNRNSGEWTVKKPEKTFGFLHEAGGRFFLNNRGYGLMELDGGELNYIDGGSTFADFEIWTITRVNGQLIVGTQNNGLYVLDGGIFTPWDTEVNNFLLKNRLFSFEKTENNLFWGTIQDGMVVTDHQGRIISHLNKKTGLNNNTVLSLFIDKERNLWLGLDNGIDQVFVHSPLSYVRTTNDIGAGYCAAVFQGRVYLGTNQGLFWIPFSKGAISSITIPEAVSIPECTGQVWSLMVVDDELLVGHNRGTFSIRGDRVKQIYDLSGGWNFNYLPGYPDKLLQGTYDGLVVFQKGRNGIEFGYKIEGFDETSRVVFVSGDKTIWMGHGYKGIFRIMLNDDLRSVSSIKVFGKDSGLGTDNFNELLKAGDEILVSNSEGIFIFSPEKDDFFPSQLWNKAFSEGGRITHLIEWQKDDYYYFQAETSGHLKIFYDTLFIKDQRVLALINQSYISSFENVSPLKENELLIGADNGFVHLDRTIRFERPVEIPFHFKYLRSLRKQGKIDFSLEFLENPGENSQDHPLSSIPYRDNDLRISFVSPFLTDPQNTLYQYKFKGQGYWSEWSDNPVIDFINLREGEYYLQVRARNIFGDMSDENTLYIKINTPWFRSIVAYISYFIIVFLGIVLIWLIVNKQLERERRRTKLLEERRMLHTQLKLRRDSQLAEQEIVKLRNEKLRADIRHKSKELANQTMGILQKNRFLTELKDEIVKLRKKAQNEEVKSSMKRMIKKINRNIEDEDSQKVFETNFDQVHENFLQRMRDTYPNLSAKDLRLCSYLRLNLTSKEIAPLLNISVRGVEISRYRLRKKLGLPHDENLADFILRF